MDTALPVYNIDKTKQFQPTSFISQIIINEHSSGCFKFTKSRDKQNPLIAVVDANLVCLKNH